MESITKRPAGITLIAILSLAAGIIYLLQGIRILGWVAFGPAQAFSSVSLVGWWTLLVGVIWIVVAGAFLSLKPWAWLFGVIMVGFSLIEAFFGNLNGWQLGDMLAAMIVPLIILFYLSSEHVKAAFGLGEAMSAPAVDPVPAPVASPPAPAPVVATAAVAAAAPAAAPVAAPVPAPIAAPVAAAPAPVPAPAAAPVVVDDAPKGAHVMKIEDVEGIGPAFSEKLAAVGIATTDDLLMAGAKPYDRERLAERTGISGKLIREWVDNVDLMRIPGVGPQYSDLLEAAGVGSPAELAQRNPVNLEATIQSVVAERPGIVRRVPSEAEIAGWIEGARTLDQVVEH